MRRPYRLLLLIAASLCTGALLLTSAADTQAVATTFTVNSTADPGDGVCDATECTLREAIDAANANAGKDTIAFNLIGDHPHTIRPLSELPVILDAVVIDGRTQPSYSEHPVVEIDGSLAVSASYGLRVAADMTEIIGLAINRFNDGAGLEIIEDEAWISGNYIGTDYLGQVDMPNALGVYIETARDNQIGGFNEFERNVVSGNNGAGIYIFGGRDNSIFGNLIGTDATGTTGLPNGLDGIHLVGADGTTVGLTYSAGPPLVIGNVISGNSGSGIHALGSYDLVIQGNLIGTTPTGVAPLPNGGHGVELATSDRAVIASNLISGNAGHGLNLFQDARDNHVTANQIGLNASGQPVLGNGLAGIAIFNGGSGNRIDANSIGGNAELGIDLRWDGVTPNDPSDNDFGANGLQNFPDLSSAGSDGSQTVIDGVLNTHPGTYTLQFFSNTACDESGFGEGETFLGADTVTVTTGEPGVNSFDAVLPADVPDGHFITATATDPDDNTSEFSACVPVTDDADGDGVPNEQDACPDLAGPAGNDGCPLPDPPAVGGIVGVLSGPNSGPAADSSGQRSAVLPIAAAIAAIFLTGGSAWLLVRRQRG